jgi:hypothetical protein
MSRKTIILIVALVIILGSLTAFYIYLQKTSNPTNDPNKKTFSLGDFFPFGKNSPQNNGTPSGNNQQNNQSNQQNNVSNATPPILRHISTVPVAGAAIFNREVTSTTTASTTGSKVKVVKTIETFIRYMERATGHVYETSTSSLETIRVSNTTFPKVYEAFFDSTGQNIIAQLLQTDSSDQVSTYYGQLTRITPTSTQEVLTTSLISTEAEFVVPSFSKTKIFSYGSIGGAKGVVSNFDGSKKSGVFTSPYTEWVPAWANNTIVTLTTRPSASANGLIYSLNTDTKSLTKLAGPLPGLTGIMSPNLNSLVMGYTDKDNKSVLLGVLDIKANDYRSLFIKTLPEKCTWSTNNTIIYCAVPDYLPQATYPDAWYQGLISFADSIWKINLTTGEAKVVAPLREMVREDIDAVSLSLDTKEDYLIFTNKKDLTLWGLKLETTSSSTVKATF